jgi:hypothetical protein
MNTTESGYGSTFAICKRCGRMLQKARARLDGEDTYCGYNPCSAHPNAGAEYVDMTKEDNITIRAFGNMVLTYPETSWHQFKRDTVKSQPDAK